MFRKILTLLVLFLAAQTPVLAEDSGLPVPECVRLLRSARIAQMEGDPAAELATLREARERFPGELAPIVALLDRHKRQPLPEAEERQLFESLVTGLASRERPLPAATLEYFLRNPDTDEDLLRLALEHVTERTETAEPPDLELLRLEARLEKRLGDEEAAVATLNRAWEASSDAELLWPLFRGHQRLGNWPEALGFLDLMSEAKLEVPRREIIPLLAKSGEVERLRAAIEREAEGTDFESPTQVELFTTLLESAAWDLRDAGFDTEAEALFRRVLEHRPRDATARAAVLYLYGTEEERQAHAAALDERWQEEENPQRLLDEGTQRLATGDAAGAIDLLRRAAPEFPELEAVWYNLGLAGLRLEDWETTASSFSRAVEINPERPDSHFFLGLALRHLDRCSEAVVELELALELAPGRPSAYYYLSECHHKLGNADAARAAYEAYQASQK